MKNFKQATMPYGKVAMKQDWRGDWYVMVGSGDDTILMRAYHRREVAYSDARHIRQMLKRGEFPSAVCQILGGYTISQYGAS